MSDSATTQAPDWNSFARKQAHERFRKQSAIMGSELTRLIVRQADVHPNMQVLDVACGSGEPAISIAAQMNGTGQVVGTDISTEPLAVARDRAQQRGLTNLQFQEADVAKLPLANESFDRVTCRLGLMYFADVPRSLAEIRRVLRPEGRFTAATWGPISQPYFEITVGTILRFMPYLSIPEAAHMIFRFGDPDTVRRALQSLGFADVHSELRTVAWNWEGSPQELWQYFQAVTVPFAALFQAIPAGRKAEIDRAVEMGIARLFDGTRVRIDAQFTLATAVKG
ncbi:MAG TPA: methyltransferase domain-containing protein [Terriglobales bacterium]|nr:methyltransferase domain-containing protein [Terriglobales bacterium]